ncbi:MAG: hypothetical protein L6R40_001126 [Gallowayella cf. fulva]|nr:MAG: hypothetical protein L6R40_001126 [Xanthomendoza cf. fulva]
MNIEEGQKRSFFDELYELDVSDTSVNDVDSLLTSLKAIRTARKSRPPSPIFNRRRANQRKIQSLERAVSAPSRSITTTLEPSLVKAPLAEGNVSSEAAKSPVTTSILVGTAGLQPHVVPSPQIETSPLQMTATAKKRKRGRSVDVLPEAQRIFSGRRFYFLPNDDVAPARRLRITKVLERGGIWIRNYSDDATHIILDRKLTYDDLLKYLKRSSIPSGIAVVNEQYPADCIQYRTLLNPDQAMYYVQGHPQKVGAEQQDSAGVAAAGSLQLNPEKRAEARRSPTPTRTESGQQPAIDQPAPTNPMVQSPPDEANPPASMPRDRPTDALDAVIEEMRTFNDLPLDDEDPENLTSGISMIGSDNGYSQKEPEKVKVEKHAVEKSWQSKFTCMEKHTGTEAQKNPNARTIEVLQQMADYYDRTNDHWRHFAYRKALAALKKQTRRITTKEEAFALPSIGERLAIKIEEIVLTNRLRRLENTDYDATDVARQLFLNIYCVGHSQASLWINAGYRTLEDLTTKATLTKNQKVGIEHIDDFATRISRKEVEHHGQIVRDAIAMEDPKIEVTIGGSYRRGAADSGDIDFIITKPDASMETLRTIILDTVIPALFRANYLRHALASTSRTDGSKWHGCATLPGSNVWHRVDFLLVPEDEIGAALIYFTGNDIFNRSIRLLASRKGMRLNQRGLWRDVLRGKGRERVTQGALVNGRSEKKIFEVLGVPWRTPEERNC